MFDFSLPELGVVCVVALIALGPDEMVRIVKFCRDTTAHLRQIFAKYMDEINEVTGVDDLVKVVFDDDGNPHKAYNLDKIKPRLKKDV